MTRMIHHLHDHDYGGDDDNIVNDVVMYPLPPYTYMQNVPQRIDANTFLAPTIASEVRAFVPLLHDLDGQAFRQLLEATLVVLKDGQVSLSTYTSSSSSFPD